MPAPTTSRAPPAAKPSGNRGGRTRGANGNGRGAPAGQPRTHRFILNSWQQLESFIADPKGFFSTNYVGGASGTRLGRWAAVSTSGREINEFGYQVYITDLDIKYLIERDPTAKFIVEAVAADTWREWAKFDVDLLNELFVELFRMGLLNHFMSADISNRAFGVGIVVVGLKDGKDAEEPLSRVDGTGEAKGREFRHNEGPEGNAFGPAGGVASPMVGATGGGVQGGLGAPSSKAGKGQYGGQGLMAGLTPWDEGPDQGDEEQEQKEKAKADLRKRVKEILRHLDYLEVFRFEDILEFRFDTDPDSDTFGEVESYRVQVVAGDRVLSKWVHASRVIHFKEDKTTKEPVGKRVLDPVFDALQLLRQMEWAAAEAYYQRVVPPFVVTVKDDPNGPGWTLGEENQKKLEQQFQDFKTGVRDWLGLEGIEITPLSGAENIQDPENTFRMLVSRIAVGTGVPARKLILAAKGAIAESAEDRKEYEAMVRQRQRTYAEACVRRFIEILVNAGVLNRGEVGDYEVDWNPITPMTELEKAQVATAKVGALLPLIQEGITPPADLDYQPTDNEFMKSLAQKAQQGGGGGQGYGSLSGFGGGGGPEGLPSAMDRGLEGEAPSGNQRRRRLSVNVPRSVPPHLAARVDWPDEKVTRHIDQFVTTLEGVLYDAAEDVERHLSSRIAEVYAGGKVKSADVLRLDVPEGFRKKLAEALAKEMERMALRSATEMERVVREQKPHAILTGNAEFTGDDADIVRMALRSLGLTVADRFIGDAVNQARAAVTQALMNRETPTTLPSVALSVVNQFWRRSVPVAAEALGVTAFNQGRNYFFVRNQGSIPYVEFRNPLDDRTTPICRARANIDRHGHGIVVAVGTAAYYQNIPPLHFGCRSWMSPKVLEPGDQPTDKRLIEGLVPKQPGF